MYCTEEVVWTIQRKSPGDLSGERTEADKKDFNDENFFACFFYSEDVINISVDGFLPLNIQKNTDINDKILNQIHRKGSKKDQVVGSKEVKENEQN